MFSSIAIAAALLVGIANAAPCDIYEAAGTPCVAAHSPVRSLYNAYTGPLYQVQRLSDNKTQDIHPLEAGGIANAATQDEFCPNNDCMFSIIYDQSGHGNDLTVCQGLGWVTYPDDPVNATQHPITVGGHKAYGMWFTFGTGYRNGKGNGVPKGDEAEAIYMVTSGIHADGGCCFDYGNAETSGRDDGKASMEALNIANWGGMGVSIGVDMEQSTYSGDCWGDSCGIPSLAGVPYITAMVKGRSGGTMAIKQADAQQSKLYTKYDGPRPDGFKVMKKQGAIILGIGGDNSNSGEGCFYEGVVVKGDPSNSTDDQVQADIAAAGYITPVTLPPPPIKYPKLHEQCGGKIYGGPTQCVDGLECVYVSEWKSECRPSTRPTTKPVTTKPATTKPVTTAPPTTVPVTTVPATTAPVTTQPVTTVPVTTAPVTTAPVTTEPATTAPVTTQPATTAPITTEPATTVPVTTAPATTQPVTTAPATTAPATTQPATTAPVTTAPATTAPVTTQPATTAPVTTAPATTAPATTAPATTVPATTQPATTAPPTTKPVTTAPATTAPVTTKPVTSAPPTTAPVTTKPATTVPVTTTPKPWTPAPEQKIPLWGQCGGFGYFGPTTCAQGFCKELNPWNSWCVYIPPVDPTKVPLWGQCGGKGYFGPTTCAQGYCKKLNDFGSWCVILPPQNPNQNQQKPPNQQD